MFHCNEMLTWWLPGCNIKLLVYCFIIFKIVYYFSERATATGATGQRLREGGSINKSLVSLGTVIKQLGKISILLTCMHLKI